VRHLTSLPWLPTYAMLVAPQRHMAAHPRQTTSPPSNPLAWASKLVFCYDLCHSR